MNSQNVYLDYPHLNAGFLELKNRCMLTGFVDNNNRTRLLETAHIKSRFRCTDMEENDSFNQFTLCGHVHRLYDARLINFHPFSGQLITVLNEYQLTKLGLSTNMFLNVQLTDKHRHYMKQRIDNYGDYLKALDKHTKRVK